MGLDFIYPSIWLINNLWSKVNCTSKDSKQLKMDRIDIRMASLICVKSSKTLS